MYRIATGSTQINAQKVGCKMSKTTPKNHAPDGPTKARTGRSGVPGGLYTIQPWTVRRSPPDGPVVQNQPFSGRRKQPRIHQNFTKTGPKLIQTSRKFAWVFLDLS